MHTVAMQMCISVCLRGLRLSGDRAAAVKMTCIDVAVCSLYKNCLPG